MKSDIIIVVLIWIFSFIIYGIWNKYTNGNDKRNDNKRGEEKRKNKKW
jgi:hypothetical protein